MLGRSDAVLFGELAPVVGSIMVLLARHAPPANTAADETGKQVATAGPARGPTGGSTERFLGGSKQVGFDDRFVDGMFGPDPFFGVVPAHLGLMSERHVPDIDENLVASLSVPGFSVVIT
jgi:hypothetical protein